MDLQPIIEYFDKQRKAQEKKAAVYRIKWKGEFLVAPSGKTVWPTISGAKTAFNRFFNPYFMKDVWPKMFPESVVRRPDFYGNMQEYVAIDHNKRREIIYRLQEHGLLEFVKLEN